MKINKLIEIIETLKKENKANFIELKKEIEKVTKK